MKYRFCMLLLAVLVVGCTTKHDDVANAGVADDSHFSDNPSEPITNANQGSLRTMIEARGKLAANFENCGQSSGNSAAKRQALAAFIQMGGNLQQFEQYYASGYDPVKRQFQAATPAERRAKCDAVHQFLQQQR